MFNLDEKYFMNPCDDKKPCHDHHPPRYTMTEDMNATMIEMRATIDRLLRFEKRVEEMATDLMRKITSDNVIFKNTFSEAYNTFLRDVRNEINVFEGNMENTNLLFTKDIEARFATVVDDNNRANAENLKNFTAKLDEAIDYMKTNIESSVATLVHEMKESGELGQIIADEILPEISAKTGHIITPQMFGAKGDGVADDTVAMQSAINAAYGGTLTIPNGTYKVGNLRVGRPLKIEGMNVDKVVFNYIGNETCLTIKPFTVGTSNDFLRVEIGGFHITTESGEIGIQITETVHSYFKDIDIVGFNIAFNVYGEGSVANFNNTYNNRFDRITIYDCDDGFRVKGCMSDSHFNNITIYGAERGIYIYGGHDIQGTNNISFVNSTIVYANKCFVVDDYHIRNLHISGCNFEQFEEYGVRIINKTADAKNISIVNSFFMPITSVNVGSVCIDLERVTGGCVNNLLFQNTRESVMGVTTSLCTLIHFDALVANNGSVIHHNIGNGCFYHTYVYENNLDTKVFNTGVKARRFSTDDRVDLYSGENRMSLRNVNGNFLIGNGETNAYVYGCYGTSVIKSLTNVTAGSCIFNDTLKKPVWWTGSAWVDATGTEI